MTDVRTVVIGPGAIGGVLAVQLHRSGQPVEVVARGAHLEAIRRDGLTRVAPDGTEVVPLRAHATIADAAVTPDDRVVIATKSHQAEPVLDQLLAGAGPSLPVACASNGVETERLALRRFDDVTAVLVNVPAMHLVPGVVEVYAVVPRGVLDVGRYPTGVSPSAEAFADSFTRAEFLSEATPDVMARKWSKLLGNVGNVCQALCGRERERWDELYGVLRAEAEAVLAAAGITPDLEVQRSRAAMVDRRDIGDRAKSGGSSWQSVERGTGDIESVALNGEIALLGRLHGVPTPGNALVQAEALRLVAAGEPAGSRDQTDLLARIAAAR